MGRGDLVAADLNRDGWVDLRDMQMAMQGGGGEQRASQGKRGRAVTVSGRSISSTTTPQ